MSRRVKVVLEQRQALALLTAGAAGFDVMEEVVTRNSETGETHTCVTSDDLELADQALVRLIDAIAKVKP